MLQILSTITSLHWSRNCITQNYFLIDKTPHSGLDNNISRFCFHILINSLASSILPPHVSTSTKVNYEKDFFCDVFDSQKMHIYFLVSSFLGQQYGLQQAWIHVILPPAASIRLCRSSNLNWGKNLIQSGILKNWVYLGTRSARSSHQTQLNDGVHLPLLSLSHPWQHDCQSSWANCHPSCPWCWDCTGTPLTIQDYLLQDVFSIC